MFSLFVGMLVSGLGLLMLSGTLYVVWGISDALDELSGRKRKRQIEKLQRASMSIGATSVVASTTQMFRDSEEDDEISELIQNAHNIQTSEQVGSVEIEDSSSFVQVESSRESGSLGSIETSSVSITRPIRFEEEITNLEEV